MSELREVVVRWQRGWGAARGLPDADDVGGGLRVVCRQPGREVEYVVLDASPASLARLARLVAEEDEVAWLTVPTTDPGAAGAALSGAGLVLLRRSELLMAVDLEAHPRRAPASGYRLELSGGAVVTATVRNLAGEVGARGTIAVSGADAVADRIETFPAHQRRGLGSALMGALASAAVARGATRGLLVASEEGQRLYATLGWRGVADVLISSAAPSA
ncbi:GNAT family N-acetyltransferase [Dactylosporangium sp. AC04546]|uniref:GNAT family N-acetyltransferase n=1 Tax=Dactylosporangium sp. AC04546 TaxID=2862460 RepID=UPI001EDFA2FE|nr:GNAT family N-acetyltransferase [Dactylosporangium sp. AC04546]WVK88556.1 GNAT family N-acetyltransferase [Dactylosporangium sp. AC04546]